MAKAKPVLTKKEEEALITGREVVPINLPSLCRGTIEDYVGEETVETNLPDLPKGMEEWIEHQPEFLTTFHFNDIGDFLLGIYIEKRLNVGENSSNIYVFQVGKKDAAQQFAVWGKSSLDLKLAKIVYGTLVYIDLVGFRKSKRGSDWYDFRVLTPKI